MIFVDWEKVKEFLIEKNSKEFKSIYGEEVDLGPESPDGQLLRIIVELELDGYKKVLKDIQKQTTFELRDLVNLKYRESTCK